MLDRRTSRRRGFSAVALLIALAVAAAIIWYFIGVRSAKVVRPPEKIEVVPEKKVETEHEKEKAKPPDPPPPNSSTTLQQKPTAQTVERLTPAQLASKIDELFFAQWKAAKIEPAARASDDEFLRRVFLDVTGKIPTAGEAAEFLEDKSADKRVRLVKRLLEHARFSNHLAVTLRETMLPGADNDPMKRLFVPGFEGWLRLRLSDGVSYDDLVREMLTARVERNDAVAIGRPRATFGPEAFTLVHESKPELLAGSAARALLGVQVQCAECHNHPFADWKQEQFWSFAAFFVSPASGATGVSTQPSLEIEIPTTKAKVPPRFLDGKSASLSSGAPAERRQEVAEWIIMNPGFEHAAANRVWWHFTGRGLVHPVDDMGANNPPSHPAVLSLLAKQFRANGFSLRYLAEAVALTDVYSRSSRSKTPLEPTSFAAMQVRTMTPEQLYDSIARAAFGRSTTYESASTEAGVLMGDTQRTQFLRKFWEPVERTGSRGSILHALAIMNGPVLAAAVNPEKGTFLHAVVVSPFLDDAARIETLFLATLTRRPTPTEAAKFAAHLKENGGDETAKRRAFADILWALLNSSEFAVTR
jgi:hypothetical protein